MTEAAFRQMALSLPHATEASHMGHPDFRVNGKIFATLAYPGKNQGVLMLTPQDQQLAIREDAKTFSPASGAWGRRGSTVVQLGSITPALLRQKMKAAWEKVAPKK